VSGDLERETILDALRALEARRLEARAEAARLQGEVWRVALYGKQTGIRVGELADVLGVSVQRMTPILRFQESVADDVDFRIARDDRLRELRRQGLSDDEAFKATKIDSRVCDDPRAGSHEGRSPEGVGQVRGEPVDEPITIGRLDMRVVEFEAKDRSVLTSACGVGFDGGREVRNDQASSQREEAPWQRLWRASRFRGVPKTSSRT
jgi:hypothetical protein